MIAAILGADWVHLIDSMETFLSESLFVCRLRVVFEADQAISIDSIKFSCITANRLTISYNVLLVSQFDFWFLFRMPVFNLRNPLWDVTR
jgi:hypothetical protein